MRSLLALALAMAATPAAGSLLIYDGFGYTPGSNLMGQTNAYSGVAWANPVTSPTQNDTHKIGAGDVSVPGNPSQQAGSLIVPPAPNAVISRIALPLQDGEVSYNVNSATGPSLYFSFNLKLTDAAPTTGADYFFAGFHWNGASGGMSVAGGYGGQLHLRPSPDSAGMGDDQEYELGVSKNNNTGFSIAWAEGEKFKADDSLFVVAQYEFVGAANANGGDDIVRLWVNPTPGDLAAAAMPSAISSTGPDAFASSQNALRSFYVRSDSNVSGTLHLDELRVGTTFGAVSVPEPASLAMAAMGLLALARRARRGSLRQAGL